VTDYQQLAFVEPLPGYVRGSDTSRAAAESIVKSAVVMLDAALTALEAEGGLVAMVAPWPTDMRDAQLEDIERIGQYLLTAAATTRATETAS
jgi:hypothetical protein